MMYSQPDWRSVAQAQGALICAVQVALDCAPPLLKSSRWRLIPGFVCSFRETGRRNHLDAMWGPLFAQRLVNYIGQESPSCSLSLSGCVRRSHLNNSNVSAQRPALANIDAICMRFGRQAYIIISGMILMYCSHSLLNQIELNNFEMLQILWDCECLHLTKATPLYEVIWICVKEESTVHQEPLSLLIWRKYLANWMDCGTHKAQIKELWETERQSVPSPPSEGMGAAQSRSGCSQIPTVQPVLQRRKQRGWHLQLQHTTQLLIYADQTSFGGLSDMGIDSISFTPY